MNKEQALTEEIANQFIKDRRSVNLSKFTSIEDAAAKLLDDCRPIELNGLTSLSSTAAKTLAKRGGLIELNGLIELSDATAQAFAGESGRLFLNGLTSLSDSAAQSLAQFDGEIELNGLTSLSDTAARALSNHKEGLCLDGLTSLSDKAAEALGKHTGEDLSLNGLQSLSDAAAQALARHKSGIYGLSLNGLKSVSNAAVYALAQHTGLLSLQGLTHITESDGPALDKGKADDESRGFKFNLNNITAGALTSFSKYIPKGYRSGKITLIGREMRDEIAEVLARSNFAEVNFKGLVTLTDNAAECLSRFKGAIEFYAEFEGVEQVAWLKTLSTKAAVALSKHKGSLSFNGNNIKLEPAAAAALLRHPRFNTHTSLKNYIKKKAKQEAAPQKTDGQPIQCAPTNPSPPAAITVRKTKQK